MTEKRTDLESAGSRLGRKNLSQRSVLFSVSFVLLLFAQTVSAQVFISEIKYTGNEWIEVSNTGASADLLLWKFFEGDTNHKLKSVQGGTSLASGGYAIIANDATAFLNEYGGFSGMLFDSSFSLLDAGETISIKSSDTNIVDTVSYTGIKGSKNSTQKISGSWSEAVPTPGAENNSSANSSSASAQTTSATATGDTAPSFETPAHARITILSGSVVPGPPIIFSGEASGSNKKSLENAYFSWTFGDGETGSGKTVSHIFRYAGNYMVTLNVSSGYGMPAVSTRMKLVVSPALLRAFTHATTSAAVDIANDGTKDVDLSSWVIEGDYYRFVIPEYTIILAGSIVTFAPETTNFRKPPVFIRILYPNGSPYEQPQKELQKEVLTQTLAVAPVIVKTTKVKSPVPNTAPLSYGQMANISDVFTSTSSSNLPKQEEGSLWPWYIGAAFLGALALLGIRLARGNEEKNTISAEDFEIIEENDPEEPH